MPAMRSITLPVLILSCGLMAGCAETRWVKEGASFEEVAQTRNVCAAEAVNGTTPSSVQFHRQRTFGKEVAAGALAGLLEAGIDAMAQASRRDDCMTAFGFHREQAGPTTVYASAAGRAPGPTVLNPPAPVALLTVMPAPAVRALVAAPAPDPIDRRRLMTEQMMRLPEASVAQTSFLLGACSAGDTSACILADTTPARSRRRLRM